MKILQIMGCTSDQYASMERYLVRKAAICKDRGHKFYVGYNSTPVSKIFVDNLLLNDAFLIKIEAKHCFDFDFYFKLLRIIKKYNINVVHGYFAPSRHYLMITAFLFGIKKRFRHAANLPLSSFHRKNSKLKTIRYYMYIFKQRLLVMFATKYICRSEAVKDEYIEIGINPAKLKVADGGADVNVYKRKHDIDLNRLINIDIKKNTFVIGTASRLIKNKGIDILIQAANKMKNKIDNFLILILGEGPERSRLELLSVKLETQNKVNFLGHKIDLYNYYNLFDVYISCSHSEGMSNSILEAMACEVPVILSDIEPNKEIIRKAEQNNMNVGFNFKTGDIDDLAKKVLFLVHNNRKRILGINARRVIKKYYSIDSRIAKELTIYEGFM